MPAMARGVLGKLVQAFAERLHALATLNAALCHAVDMGNKHCQEKTALHTHCLHSASSRYQATCTWHLQLKAQLDDSLAAMYVV